MCILTNTTLADKVLMNFSRIRLKKKIIKVPNLKAKKAAKPLFLPDVKDDKTQVTPIIDILMKNAIENNKKTKKQAEPVFLSDNEDKSYKIIEDDKDKNIGGYGTISKSYVVAPFTSYVDYGKLFSYLGKFKSQSMYESMAEHLEVLNKATESGSFVLADRDAIDKIGRYEKYMKNPAMDMPVMALSLVPIAGLSSGEWEEIKMMMKLDPVIYNLKTKIS